LAGAAGPYTTVIHAPHPDDETIRLAGYVTGACLARGDRLVLVAWTDGDGTYLVDKWGWTREKMARERAKEQEEAWRILTNGTGTVLRIGQRDGAVEQETVRAVSRLLSQVWPGCEQYTACHPTDPHVDHREVAYGVREGALGVVRHGRYPDEGPGHVYRANLARARAAGAALPIGYASAGHIVDRWYRADCQSVVTR
jgi:LmbE family N-acetylglucosaminyl deacetylase